MEAMMELKMLAEQTGYCGFTISAQSNTVEADFCKLIGEGLLRQAVGIEIDENRKIVAITMEGVSINFKQSLNNIRKISKLLGGPVRAESYYADGKAGFMIIAQ